MHHSEPELSDDEGEVDGPPLRQQAATAQDGFDPIVMSIMAEVPR